MNNIRINLVAALILCGLIHAQDFTGNYEVNYIDVNYIVTIRDTIQQDANGDDFTLETDALADYSIYMGWPLADDDEGWVDYPLITFEPGDRVPWQITFPRPSGLQRQG